MWADSITVQTYCLPSPTSAQSKHSECKRNTQPWCVLLCYWESLILSTCLCSGGWRFLNRSEMLIFLSKYHLTRHDVHTSCSIKQVWQKKSTRTFAQYSKPVSGKTIQTFAWSVLHISLQEFEPIPLYRMLSVWDVGGCSDTNCFLLVPTEQFYWIKVRTFTWSVPKLHSSWTILWWDDLRPLTSPLREKGGVVDGTVTHSTFDQVPSAAGRILETKCMTAVSSRLSVTLN